MTTEGGAPLRRVGASGETIARLVATLAEVHGYQVGPPGADAGINIQQVERPDGLICVGPAPTVAVVLRRLRTRERDAFGAAGARRVLDADATVTELAGVVVEAVFDGVCQARRVARRRTAARVPVQLQPDGGAAALGHLTALTRRAAEVATDCAVPLGTRVRIMLSACGRPLPLEGRVVWCDRARGLGLELLEPGARLAHLADR